MARPMVQSFVSNLVRLYTQSRVLAVPGRGLVMPTADTGCWCLFVYLYVDGTGSSTLVFYDP